METNNDDFEFQSLLDSMDEISIYAPSSEMIDMTDEEFEEYMKQINDINL